MSAFQEEDDFVASSKFTGARPGYIFRTGSSGVGYYRDNPLSSTSSQCRCPAREMSRTSYSRASKTLALAAIASQSRASASRKRKNVSDSSFGNNNSSTSKKKTRSDDGGVAASLLLQDNLGVVQAVVRRSKT